MTSELLLVSSCCEGVCSILHLLPSSTERDSQLTSRPDFHQTTDFLPEEDQRFSLKRHRIAGWIVRPTRIVAQSRIVITYHEEYRRTRGEVTEINDAGRPKCLTVAFYARWSDSYAGVQHE